jgi:beta-glucuronidase
MANDKKKGSSRSNCRGLRTLKKLAYGAELSLTTRETLAPRLQVVNGFLASHTANRARAARNADKKVNTMKRFVLLFCCLAAVSSIAFASPQSQQPDAVKPPQDLVANIPNRTTISLDGVWRSIVDPYEGGMHSRFWENRKSKNKQELIEYDFDLSPGLKVPGDWNMQRDSLYFYEGPVWYKKSFSYKKIDGVRPFLYFGAANYFTRVYLNGHFLGEHTGGFTPFNFDVSDTIADGDNFVVVEVNNTRHVEGVPTLNTDWWNYGGITRDVKIVEVPRTYIQDYFIQLAKGSQSEIAGWVKVAGASAPQNITIEIPEANIKQTVTTAADGKGEFHFPAKLDLWSPDSPKLYRVVVSGAGDSVNDQIGFRTIETRGNKILLNGKPIFLRGVSIHEEAPFRGGRAFAPEDDATLLGWAKELGCNFVRLAHYPHHESMVRAADRMGLLVWSEIPVYWGIDWKNPATLDNAKNQFREEIARDHNRAAIILWSLGNETPISPERTAFMKQTAAEVRELDGTRLLTAAMNITTREGDNTRLLNDPLGEIVDVLGMNEYIGWYEGTIDSIDKTHWKSSYDKPLIVSEFGAGAPAGRHGDAADRWTEEYQADLYKHQIAMWKQVPFLAGMTPWVLMDFQSPVRQLPQVQDYHNRKGLISDQGARKQAFFVLQNYYKEMSATPPQ